MLATPFSHETAAPFQRLANLARRAIPPADGIAPQLVRPVPGLGLLAHHTPTAFDATLYEPVVCLILEGSKETTIGSRTLTLSAGDCLLISHDLPVVSRVVQVPYLALLVDVELTTVRGLYDEIGDETPSDDTGLAMEKCIADPPLLDALGRCLALHEAPSDARILGPLIRREIHYRLLSAPFGGVLRQLLRFDSAASAIARAIAHIRSDYRRPITVPALARRVGMSVSSFHKHFKAITFVSPLQYQKELRLLEARRLLSGNGTNVSIAAYEVGYESPNQFSREYTRKFGVPPSRHVGVR